MNNLLLNLAIALGFVSLILFIVAIKVVKSNKKGRYKQVMKRSEEIEKLLDFDITDKIYD